MGELLVTSANVAASARGLRQKKLFEQASYARVWVTKAKIEVALIQLFDLCPCQWQQTADVSRSQLEN